VFQRDLLTVSPGTLTVYLLGPGVGETIVVVLPDGRIVVVDSCQQAGVNLAARLLTALEVHRIDLLIVTHPDLDHVKGLTELLHEFDPVRVWRYPFGLLREILAMLGNAADATHYTRHAQAVAGAVALDEHLGQRGLVDDVTYGRVWAPPGASYTVHALAPTSYDTKRARDRVRGLIEKRHGRWLLSAQAKRWLDDDAPLGDLPNMVSLGVAIEWGQRRLILAGDIENGDDSPYSGWAGVLDHLDREDDGRGRLVDDVDLIKVAHHGSARSFSQIAWERHARASKTLGVVTTYSPSRLPDKATLEALRAHCSRLGIAVDAGDAFDRAMEAGWVAAPAGQPPPESLAPCLKVVLGENGKPRFHRGQPAGWFE
jgi:beta-lactamase superfamily II metal-dependent hydrolase